MTCFVTQKKKAVDRTNDERFKLLPSDAVLLYAPRIIPLYILAFFSFYSECYLCY